MTDFKAKLEKIRDELSISYPRQYAIQYMNDDTPRLSGAEYLSFGYKQGFTTAVDETLKALREEGGEFDRHWWLQLIGNMPLRNLGAVFEKFEPVVREKNAHWLQVVAKSEVQSVIAALKLRVKELEAENERLNQKCNAYWENNKLLLKDSSAQAREINFISQENAELKAAGKGLVLALQSIAQDFGTDYADGNVVAAYDALLKHGKLFTEGDE